MKKINTEFDIFQRNIDDEAVDNPYHYSSYRDHQLRISTSINLIKWLKKNYNDDKDFDLVADLSAGDATIIKSIFAKHKYIGNLTNKGVDTNIYGDINNTLDQIPNVDLFINTETIEHLENPQEILNKIRLKTKYLIITTPLDESGQPNGYIYSHRWSWGREDILTMLKSAGFEPLSYSTIEFFEHELFLNYQVWICR